MNKSRISPFQINTQFKFCLIFFSKMAAGSHFGRQKIIFHRISRHFINKLTADGHFGCPNIIFDCKWDVFRSIHNFYFFEIFTNGRIQLYCNFIAILLQLYCNFIATLLQLYFCNLINLISQLKIFSFAVYGTCANPYV